MHALAHSAGVHTSHTPDMGVLWFEGPSVYTCVRICV
jgi:hypothetical protein